MAIVKDRLIREGCDIYKETTAKSSESTKSLEGDKDEDDDDTVRLSAKQRRLSSWLKASRQTSSTEAVSLEEKVKREIDAYEKLPRADVELDPLKWWRVHASTHPILAMLVKKYLCIPASSSASQRVFSTSGNIVSKKWSRLKPHKVNMLVFLAHNL